MSESFDADWMIDEAVAFNRAYARKIGWYRRLPEGLLDDYPKLGNDPLGLTQDAEAFAWNVQAFQGQHGLDDDGKLGRATWKVMRAKYLEEGALLYKGEMIGGQADYPITHRYDLTPEGDFVHYKRVNRKIRRIVIHWGGHSVESCSNVLANRDLSSHAGVDPETVAQYLDFGHRAWHAGGIGNENAIGVDVCQQPTVSFLNRYKQRGYDVRIIDNPARRPSGAWWGAKKVLSIESRTVDNLARFLIHLCKTFDIPLRLPRDHRVLSKRQVRKYSGILFHSHLSKTKWDIAPWFDALVAKLRELGYPPELV